MRLTWKREADERGLAGTAQGPRGYELNLGPHKAIIHVAMIRRNFNEYGGWYYYGSSKELGIPHVNTASTPPFAALEDAKASAEKYVRECLYKVAMEKDR